MKVQVKNKNVQSCAVYARRAYLTVLVIILSVSSGFAWSFDTYQGTIEDAVSGTLNTGEISLTAKSPSPSVADTCLPLLNSIRHISPNSAMDRNQRSAGKAATLGLVFGVRFALAPVHKTGSNTSNKAKARFDVWQPKGAYAGNQQALAVSAYSQCQKEQALQALSDFRWKR